MQDGEGTRMLLAQNTLLHLQDFFQECRSAGKFSLRRVHRPEIVHGPKGIDVFFPEHSQRGLNEPSILSAAASKTSRTVI